MKTTSFRIFTNKNVTPKEIADLLIRVGWEPNGTTDFAAYSQSLQASHFIAHARDLDGKLIGFINVIQGFSTYVDLLLVSPDMQRKGVGKSLLAAVEEHLAGRPFFVMPFEDQLNYFTQQGYKIARRPMIVLFKPNGMTPIKPTPEVEQILID